jgi:hypothetical protein
MALGAGSGRIVRQLLTESLLLAICGSVLGLLLTQWSAPTLMSFYQLSNSYTPIAVGGRYYDLHTDPLVVAVAIAVSLVSAITAGLLPAVVGARINITSALKLAMGTQSRQSHSQGVLITAQIGLCVALLGATALLVRSIWHVEFAAGFDPRGVIGLRLRPRLVAYPADKAQAFTKEVLRRVAVLPQVESVALKRPMLRL